jgi:hypothetical protein
LGWDKKFVKKLEATIEILFEQAEIVSHPLLHLVLLFDEAPIDSSKFLNEHNLKVGEFRVGLVEAAVQVIEALVVGVQFVSNLVKGFGGFGIHDLTRFSPLPTASLFPWNRRSESPARLCR